MVLVSIDISASWRTWCPNGKKTVRRVIFIRSLQQRWQIHKGGSWNLVPRGCKWVNIDSVYVTRHPRIPIILQVLYSAMSVAFNPTLGTWPEFFPIERRFWLLGTLCAAYRWCRGHSSHCRLAAIYWQSWWTSCLFSCDHDRYVPVWYLQHGSKNGMFRYVQAIFDCQTSSTAFTSSCCCCGGGELGPLGSFTKVQETRRAWVTIGEIVSW